MSIGDVRVSPRWVELSWRPTDQHVPFTILAGLGAVATVTLGVFGLPPVSLHTFPHELGVMFPTCGGTRAARFMATGEWDRAWQYNPLSVLLVLGAAVMMARLAVGVLTRRWLTVRVAWSRSRLTAVAAVAALLLVALAWRQQLNADLLMAGTL